MIWRFCFQRLDFLASLMYGVDNKPERTHSEPCKTQCRLQTTSITKPRNVMNCLEKIYWSNHTLLVLIPIGHEGTSNIIAGGTIKWNSSNITSASPFWRVLRVMMKEYPENLQFFAYVFPSRFCVLQFYIGAQPSSVIMMEQTKWSSCTHRANQSFAIIWICDGLNSVRQEGAWKRYTGPFIV